MSKNPYANPVHLYPPYLYLTQVAEHCSRAVSTYMFIWKQLNENNRCKISKDDIRSEHMFSLCKFKNDLHLLVKEGLVSVEETPNWLIIDAVDWDEQLEDHFAC